MKKFFTINPFFKYTRNMPEPAVSQRILDHLATHPPATIRELSNLLDVTPADVRYHLKLLIRTGLVQVLEPELPARASRGRPAHRYKRSVNSAPHNLPHLCDSLLQYVLHSCSSENLDVVLAGITEILAGEPLTGTGAIRLKKAASWLSDHQYQARWEARRSGPVILFHNCPYTLLLEKHPLLCRMDEYLLSRLTGLNAIQTARIQPGANRPGECVFEIK